MMSKFYIFAWLMLAASVVFSLRNAPMSGLEMMAFGIAGLVLVYTLLVWAVLTNSGEATTEWQRPRIGILDKEVL